MEYSKICSIVLVTNQFACLLFFAVSGHLISSTLPIFCLDILTIMLAMWAILVMRLPNLTVMPEPKPQTQLIKRGPYAIIRHPMYTSIILICLSLLLDTFTYYRLFVFLLLLVNQIIKLNYEERLLVNKFPEYIRYQKISWKLIPFVY